MYVNARSIINKLLDFQAVIASENPDVVGITESWSHSDISDSELLLADYELFRQDRPSHHRGGGVLLYVKKTLNPLQYYPDSRYPEQVWCQINKKYESALLIGVCYRSASPQFASLESEIELRKLITEISTKHFLLMGDFNFPEIDWSNHTCLSNASVDCKLFHECIDDSFVFQHVHCDTRANAILDLVITDEPDMVPEVISLGPFSTSDHNLLKWTVIVNIQNTVNAPGADTRLDYVKGD